MGCYFSLRDGKSRSLRPTARWQRQRILVGVEGCVVPSVRACDDADIDYTFAQVAMKEASVDYNCNCGGMSSAVGSFAVDEQIVSVRVDDVTLRIFDTKTQKLFSPLSACPGGCRALSEGKLQIPGISGTAAPIRLGAPNYES